MAEPRDEIDELVDWQLRQGQRRGDGPLKPTPVRTVAHSVVAAQPANRPSWLENARRALTFDRKSM